MTHWRVVVLADQGRKSLVREVPVAPFRRTVSEITTFAREQFDLNLFCLFMAENTAVCRTIDDRGDWGQKAESEILDKLAQYNSGEIPNVFARYGWLEDFKEWIRPYCGEEILQIEHHNASEFFTLLRVCTPERNFWFKAVGEPNTREFALTQLLSDHFEEFVPPVLAAHPAWNGWLTEEIAGSPLDECADLDVWLPVFEGLAELQVESRPHLREFLSAGARDWRTPVMLARLDSFFDAMGGVMQVQPKEPPRRMSRQELEDLAFNLTLVCREYETLGIPDTLIHGDINPFNIFVRDNRPVFLDWAETYVGNPFLCAQHLLVHFERSHPSEIDYLRLLRDAYNLPWRDVLSDDVIERAWELAPCVAPLLNALYLPDVDIRHMGTEARRGAFLRSLTRTMKRELERSYGNTSRAIA